MNVRFFSLFFSRQRKLSTDSVVKPVRDPRSAVKQFRKPPFEVIPRKKNPLDSTLNYNPVGNPRHLTRIITIENSIKNLNTTPFGRRTCPIRDLIKCCLEVSRLVIKRFPSKIGWVGWLFAVYDLHKLRQNPRQIGATCRCISDWGFSSLANSNTGRKVVIRVRKFLLSYSAWKFSDNEQVET